MKLGPGPSHNFLSIKTIASQTTLKSLQVVQLAVA